MRASDEVRHEPQEYVLLEVVCRLQPAKYHRLRGSASPVLTATGLVNGKWQFSTPHRIDTPQPITKKFVTGDYTSATPTAEPN